MFSTRRGFIVTALFAFTAWTAGSGVSHADSWRGAEEPTGGKWKPVLLSSARDARLPAPPALGSPKLLQELLELRDLQSRRTPQVKATVAYWDAGACIRWNEVARQLVVKYNTSPPKAARLYALVSVAQYDALVAAWHNKSLYDRPAPGRVDRTLRPLVETPPIQVYPSEHAVVAAASATVLTYLFPGETASLAAIAQEHEISRLYAGASYRSDIAAGDALGRAVAQRVVEYAQTDGSDAIWTGSIPVGPGMWTGTNPLLPEWGNVRPWLMTSGSQFRPAPPPAYGSPEFQAAVAEVRQLSDTRTPEQLRIARFWADGAGTVTPPGHWNQIACDIIAQTGWSELRTARALALTNMAMMDAGICCWDAKYAYWLLRPSHADPAITLPVGLPNFPSYTSGHSTFSGAAAEVLGYLFPNERKALRAMAEEAAMSRLYGGIHYRFDSDIGLEGGRTIAALAIQRAKKDGAPGH